MDNKELIKYELPSMAEFISIKWLQNIIGWYYGKMINRKLKRYNKRLQRDEFLKRFNN